MIERVAKAIAKQHQDAAEPYPDDLMPEYRAMARAALEAMREPTDEMIEAVNRKERQMLQGPAGARLHYSVAFRAMIDAALETGK